MPARAGSSSSSRSSSPRKAPPKLATVAAGNDRAATLRALRDRVARELDKTDSARDVAALSRQMTEVLAQLEAIPTGKEISAADEVAARRASRSA